MQNSLYKLFEHKCVLEVCVHIHPIMIKIHPVCFLIPILTLMYCSKTGDLLYGPGQIDPY